MTKRGSAADRPSIWLIRRPQGLVPAYNFDDEYLRRYRIGARVAAYITEPKNPGTLRVLHGMIDIVARATGQSADQIKTELKYKAKLISGVSVSRFDGTTLFETRSFADLDQAELQEFMDGARLHLQDMFPDIDVAYLLQQARDHVGLGEDL